MNITKEELAGLEECQSSSEWSVNCELIKERRGGNYPPNWWNRVMVTGMADRIVKRWSAAGASLTVGPLRASAMKPCICSDYQLTQIGCVCLDTTKTKKTECEQCGCDDNPLEYEGLCLECYYDAQTDHSLDDCADDEY